MSLNLINPKKHRQLFLDDFAVESVEGAVRTLHSPKKWGVVLHSDGNQSRSCPQWNSEKKLCEWWYFGQHSYYAVSEDGEHWEKPALGLYE